MPIETMTVPVISTAHLPSSAPYGWVRFDCDADPVPELTTYNW